MSELNVVAKLRMLAKGIFTNGHQGTAKKLSELIDELENKSEWISVESYRDIPVGTWQVATEARGSRDAETHIAKVEKNVTIIGNCFAFDLPRVYAYAQALQVPPKQ